MLRKKHIPSKMIPSNANGEGTAIKTMSTPGINPTPTPTPTAIVPTPPTTETPIPHFFILFEVRSYCSASSFRLAFCSASAFRFCLSLILFRISFLFLLFFGEYYHAERYNPDY